MNNSERYADMLFKSENPPEWDDFIESIRNDAMREEREAILKMFNSIDDRQTLYDLIRMRL